MSRKITERTSYLARKGTPPSGYVCVASVSFFHHQDPGNVNQICVNRSNQTVICTGEIDVITPGFDQRIAATGFVDYVLIQVGLQKAPCERKGNDK